MRFSAFSALVQFFMMASELRLEKITGSWGHSGEVERTEGGQEGSPSLEAWGSAGTALCCFIHSAKPTQDRRDSVLGHLPPTPHAKLRGSFGKPLAAYSSPPYLTPDVGDVTPSAFPLHPAAGPAHPLRSGRHSPLHAGKSPFSAPHRFGAGAGPTQQNHHWRWALHAVNRTKFAIK